MKLLKVSATQRKCVSNVPLRKCYRWLHKQIYKQRENTKTVTSQPQSKAVAPTAWGADHHSLLGEQTVTE